LICRGSLVTELPAGGKDRLDAVALYSLMWSAIIVFSTVHVQDFADVEGDMVMGRKTLPIVAPVGSRTLTVLTLLAYSWYVTEFWDIGPLARTLLVLYGAAIAWRYARFHACDQDKRTYLLYNVGIYLMWEARQADPRRRFG
jgi:4-hydroxybenzoate polyprenyltransferase